MKYLSDGWIGQINRVSKKQSISNIVTFKKITLETIFIDGLDKEMEKILKSRILDLINKIDRAGHPWYKETWKDDWLSLILINKNWFKQMWSDEEFEIIKLIDKEVTSGNITNIYKTIVPSDAILNLKEQFDKITFN
ncbi:MULTISPECIES: hypothetical protein [Flavobacterium]|nr:MULTISPECIES: hypothetical protein [Flavobacterium]